MKAPPAEATHCSGFLLPQIPINSPDSEYDDGGYLISTAVKLCHKCDSVAVNCIVDIFCGEQRNYPELVFIMISDVLIKI